MEGNWRIGRDMPSTLPSVQPPGGKAKREDFAALLSEEENRLKPVSFSRHAEERMRERRIALTPEMLQRLEKGVSRAGEKGAKETLVILDHLFFVVSVTNKTVITAMDKGEAKENLFTQIDSAVLM